MIACIEEDIVNIVYCVNILDTSNRLFSNVKKLSKTSPAVVDEHFIYMLQEYLALDLTMFFDSFFLK